MRILAFITALLIAPALHAKQSIEEADIVIIGEIHDNSGHHALQAQIVSQLTPKAVVYEMLTPDEGLTLQMVDRNEAAILEAIRDFHWSSLNEYSAILLASEQIIGAAQSREMVRGAYSDGAAAFFGEEAALYGLDDPLPAAQHETRAKAQFDAHCQAMPLEMMGGMIEAQRFRDAAFARAVVDAVETYGTPIVLITGNGHARKDWGVPVYLNRARPDLTVFSLGQSEGGELAGKFDAIAASPPAERDDPCKAFE